MTTQQPLDEGKTPGQQAAAAIQEAKALLNDANKAEYHERLSAAINKMQGELDFWNQLAAVMAVVDIANETT